MGSKLSRAALLLLLLGVWLLLPLQASAHLHSTSFEF